MSPNPESRSYRIGAARFTVAPLPPGLYITATPIGNLGDITLRALETLAGVETVLCEDTRVTAKLLTRYDIRTRLSPYHDHNAAKVRPHVVGAIAGGAAIALVSDAGMPLVSDPGYRLVGAVVEAGLPVTVIPGPSAALAALALSGLPSDRFLFVGFLPPKRAARRKTLAELKDITATLLLFEGPSRLIETLEDIEGILGARRIAVGRELTKLHEEVLRGTAAEVADKLRARDAIKGEVTLAIAGKDQTIVDEGELAIALRAAANQPPSRAAVELARRFNLPKRDIYARLLALRAAE
jgi:16S rRNA (cytidine1402-2'-O)-methyltransferase